MSKAVFVEKCENSLEKFLFKPFLFSYEYGIIKNNPCHMTKVYNHKTTFVASYYLIIINSICNKVQIVKK
jgi:hypothetical protein